MPDMPEDPFTPDQSKIDMYVDSVDRRKAETGKTWSQYLSETIEQFEQNLSSDVYTALDHEVDHLKTILPDLQSAERLESPEFTTIKHNTVRSVLGALTVMRQQFKLESN